MSCLYSNFNGECSMFDGEICDMGCDSDGFCMVEEDPEPSRNCFMYDCVENVEDCCWS